MLQVENPDVLRRALLDLEHKIPTFATSIAGIDPLVLDGTNDVELIANKVTELINAVNAVTSALNKTTRNKV